MQVREILQHFLDRSDWVDPAATVDRVIMGDPEVDADRCVVTWMPSMTALRHAVARGIRLVICHEPTFWNHRDEPQPQHALYAEKCHYIEEHALTIMRNHDCWDRWPGIGIPFAWARFLGFDGPPADVVSHGYQHRYDIAPCSLDHLAVDIANRCATVGEPSIQVVGEGSARVSCIGIGTGCACGIPASIEMGCDCCIVADDGIPYWQHIELAREMGLPVIRINHGTSEEPGMVTLAAYINEHL